MSEMIVTKEAARGAGSSLAARYDARLRAVFLLEIWGICWSVLSLGFFRFWAKTAQRRQYWSNLRIGGHAVEYSGRGVEIFIGSLIAIVMLSFYLVLVFLVLNLVALNSIDIDIQQSLIVMMQVTLLPLLPLAPYAIYRGQRYFVGRLRWRGVRLTMENAAWRYTGRALLWMIGIILTAGLLKPVADYHQRAFITRRMRYGDIPFRLTGSPARLYRCFAPCIAAALALVGLVCFTAYEAAFGRETNTDVMALLLIGIGLFGTVGYFWYLACRRAFFIRHTTLGDVGLENEISGASVFWLRVKTWLAIPAALLTFGALFYAALLLVAEAVGVDLFAEPQQIVQGPNALILALLSLISLLILFGVTGACHHAIYNSGLMRRAAEGLRVRNPASLDHAKQTPDLQGLDGGGFADAIGANPF